MEHAALSRPGGTGGSRLAGQAEQVLAKQTKRPGPDTRGTNDCRAEPAVDAIARPREPATAPILNLQRQADSVELPCELAQLPSGHRWSPALDPDRDARTAAKDAERPTIDLYIEIGLNAETSPAQLLGSVVLIVTAP